MDIENALYFPSSNSLYSELTSIEAAFPKQEVKFHRYVPFQLPVTFGDNLEPQMFTFWAYFSESTYPGDTPIPTEADKINGPLLVTRDSRWPGLLSPSFVQAIRQWRKANVMKERLNELIDLEQETQLKLSQNILQKEFPSSTPDLLGQLAQSSLKENVYKYLLIQFQDYSYPEARSNILNRLVNLISSGRKGEELTSSQCSVSEVSILAEIIKGFNLLGGI